MVNRQQLAKSCEHLYRRAGRTTARSGVYSELREDVRSAMDSPEGLVQGELPIVASFIDSRHWLLATTDRAAFRTGGEVTSLPWNHIQIVHSLTLEDGNSDRDDVLVLIADGDRHEVQIEAGYPMGGMWSVMRRLMRAWGAENEGPEGSEGPTSAEP